jgi:probable rRNA maturation factor
MPPITIFNRQRRVRFDLGWLRRCAAAAVAPCFAARSGTTVEIPAEVEVSIVSDRVIARVHRDFMGLPDPTDVITFQHGEIVASADTAQARAAELGHSVEAELSLYIVHGLLHLNGFDDASPRDAARMRKVQHRIWRACLESLPPPA